MSQIFIILNPKLPKNHLMPFSLKLIIPLIRVSNIQSPRQQKTLLRRISDNIHTHWYLSHSHMKNRNWWDCLNSIHLLLQFVNQLFLIWLWTQPWFHPWKTIQLTFGPHDLSFILKGLFTVLLWNLLNLYSPLNLIAFPLAFVF